ncbi:endonuclease domain-containing protein [Desulfonema limicola]|uniref:Endonuclease domain-containing protein n=1 Tax=Desulfonema limicola TaxID=45656 RepID=A0A975BDM8_9BACT|nr:hypothetical protein [Desulfonema limicola]QTA83587.1 endonuclease domain-containing protein [Desulfonema limicola]
MAQALQKEMKEMQEKIEEYASKFVSLDMILGQFMISTHKSISRLERSISDFKDEMKDFKDEMKDFKDEMKDFKDEMTEFKNESERDRKRMNKQWGELANKMGTLVEDIVAPNITGIAKKYFNAEDLEFFAVRVKKANTKNRAVKKEFDIVAVSENYLIVNETKSTPRPEYVRDFINSLPEIKDYFPEYSDKKIIPIFSSLYIPSDIQAYLTKQGIYAMGMKDETMEILNFEEVKEIMQ